MTPMPEDVAAPAAPFDLEAVHARAKGMYDHIIFVSLDTLRSDCIRSNPLKLWPGKYPNLRQPETAILDEIVQASAFFPNCISAAPYTSASHATFFTGRWPLRHGVYEFFNRRLTAQTIFTQAKRLGMRTMFKVDFPIILGPFLGFDRDVDQYIVEDDDAFLSSFDPQTPSCCFVHFGGVHVPYGFHNLRYGGSAYQGKVAELESEVPRLQDSPVDRLVETYRQPEDLDLMLRYKRIVQHYFASGNYEKLFSLYLEGVEFFLRERFAPFWRNLLARLAGTRYLIVLFGDHGEEYDANSYGHHNTLAEGVIRVPVLFHGSQVRPGLYLDRIRSVDVAPTVLTLLDVAELERLKLDGTSLMETVLHGAQYPERRAYSQVYCADAKDYVAFQQRMLASGKKSGSLRHVRFKEAVYDGPFKLTRQNYEYTEDGGIWGLRRCQPQITLEQILQGKPRTHIGPPSLTAQLLQLLDEYNTLCPDAEESADVTAKVRSELQIMGYKI